MKNAGFRKKSIQLVSISPLLNKWQRDEYIRLLYEAEDDKCMRVIELLERQHKSLAHALRKLKTDGIEARSDKFIEQPVCQQ